MLNNDIPQNTKVNKPWGSEYTIYKNSVSSTKLLKIEKFKSTSLHCHPTKKTGFILIKGEVNVDLGFYNKKKLSSISRLMIRPGLFHSTSNNAEETAVILEIETPIDKDDLVRFKDEYGRENTSYEGENKMTDLDKNDIKFEDPKLDTFNEYMLEGKRIIIEKLSKDRKIKLNNYKEIFAILGGGLFNNKGLCVLSPGDIVSTDTVLKLSENFRIIDNITFLRIKYD